MRNAIKERLVTNILSIEGRCFEPQQHGAGSPKPALVVNFSEEKEHDQLLWAGQRPKIDVTVYDAYTDTESFTDIDAMVKSVINALTVQPLTTQTGEVFSCEYLGMDSDQVDQVWNCISRVIHFKVSAIQPVAITETVANDPWLEAFALWSESTLTSEAQTLGTDWHVYRNVWPSGYEKPAVLWRVSNIEVRSKSKALFEIKKKVIGHLYGDTPNQQLTAIILLLQKMGCIPKLALGQASGKYLTLVDPQADTQAHDPIATGQISLWLSRLTPKPLDEVPLIGAVNIEGNL